MSFALRQYAFPETGTRYFILEKFVYAWLLEPTKLFDEEVFVDMVAKPIFDGMIWCEADGRMRKVFERSVDVRPHWAMRDDGLSIKTDKRSVIMHLFDGKCIHVNLHSWCNYEAELLCRYLKINFRVLAVFSHNQLDGHTIML